MDPKPWYESKTLWLNALALTALILDAVIQSVNVVPVEAIPYLAMALTIINIVLRFVTNQPVTLRRG